MDSLESHIQLQANSTESKLNSFNYCQIWPIPASYFKKIPEISWIFLNIQERMSSGILQSFCNLDNSINIAYRPFRLSVLMFDRLVEGTASQFLHIRPI